MPDYPISSSHKIQVATFFRESTPLLKTAVDFEIAVSNNDANLFSTTDDSNNQGVSAKINTKQRLLSKNGLPMPSNYQFIKKI
jgi:hypothetical protein